MAIDVGRALRGGLAGWAGMTGMLVLARRLGLTKMNLMDVEGSLFAEQNSVRANLIGFGTHLALSMSIGFAYALGFQLTHLRPSWRTGLLGGFVHWAVAVPVTGVVSAVYPKRRKVPMPGFGGLAMGVPTALGFLLGHFVYGVLFTWQFGGDGADDGS